MVFWLINEGEHLHERWEGQEQYQALDQASVDILLCVLL